MVLRTLQSKQSRNNPHTAPISLCVVFYPVGFPMSSAIFHPTAPVIPTFTDSGRSSLEGALTTPDQVEDFIATGIDFLAPAFGNVHGDYGKKGPVLEYDRLEMIRQKVGGRVRLVVHGTNDWPEELTKKCVAGGCVKVNVNKLVLLDYLNYLKSNAPSKNLTTLMEEGTHEIQKLTEWAIDVCGSTGKA